MKLEPVENWITGIAMVHKKPSPIVAPNPSANTTRCYLIESVGPKAAEAGYARGDVVVAKSVYDLLFYGGAYHRVTFLTDEVIQRVREAPLDEFLLLDGETPAASVELAAE